MGAYEEAIPMRLDCMPSNNRMKLSASAGCGSPGFGTLGAAPAAAYAARWAMTGDAVSRGDRT